jgi:hypothetical protein
MRVQARRDEAPDLPQHDRQRQQEGRHEQNLERHHERRDHRGGNQRGALGQVRHQGRGQQVVELARAREKEQQGGGNAHGDRRLDQAVAQLHEVLHEGLLGTGQLVFFVGGFGHVGGLRTSRPAMQRQALRHHWNFCGR